MHTGNTMAASSVGMKHKLLKILSTGLLAGLMTAPALAAPPTTELFVIDNESSLNTTLCPFPITFIQNGSFKITTYYDKKTGLPVKWILTNQTRYTETATANGKTLLTNYPQQVMTFYVNGTESTAVGNGLRAAYTVPGSGVVLIQTGRVIFDLNTNEVLFEAGPQEIFNGLVEDFCAYFAP